MRQRYLHEACSSIMKTHLEKEESFNNKTDCIVHALIKKLSTSAYVKRLSVKIEAVISGMQGELASGAECRPLFMALYYLVIRH